ncbi:MAG: YqaE/Pmp3 family membrane protein [Lewinellaceae bacterium]|nr:YqaE/Pmp3 family membrane protein [Lewinellaceae bacterium]
MDDSLLLLVLVTILLPPLGMYLYEGAATNRFWISLVLWLLFYVPGLIYTLYVILSEN